MSKNKIVAIVRQEDRRYRLTFRPINSSDEMEVLAALRAITGELDDIADIDTWDAQWKAYRKRAGFYSYLMDAWLYRAPDLARAAQALGGDGEEIEPATEPDRILVLEGEGY